jgi:hypothetical protein
MDWARILAFVTGMVDQESLRLDARELDHIGPFLGFLSNEISEVGGRAGKDRVAQVGEPRLELGIGEARIDVVIEPVDNLGRRARSWSAMHMVRLAMLLRVGSDRGEAPWRLRDDQR